MKTSSSNTGTIAKSAGTVSFAVMCSRVLGLVREQVFAAMFGAGFAYDSFVVAFRIPNLLRDLFGEGALSTAFVTVFSDYDTNKSKEKTWQLANTVLAFFAVFLSLITLVGIFCTRPILMLLAPEFELIPGKMELTSKLTVIMFPFLIFISLSAVVMGILNTKGRFFVPSIASSFFNLGSIIGGLSLAFLAPQFGQPAIAGMAVGTLIGGFLQLAIQLPTLFKTGFTFRPRLNLADPGLKRILLLMVPAVIGLSATQFNIFINTNFASSCAEGSVSWLNYSFRLVQLPIGLFGVAISIASLPLFARYASLKDTEGLRHTYTSSILMAFCLTIPATVGLVLLAEPIIRIIFEHGAFTAFDTIKTAEALKLYAVGLFAYAAVKIIVPVFYALNDTRFPVIGSFMSVAINVCIILLTIEQFQHRAIALSTSCTMTINFLFLSIILYRKLDGYPLSYIMQGLGKIITASLVMGGSIMAARTAVAGLSNYGLFGDIAALIILIGGGALIYGSVLYGLRLQEMTTIVEKIKERLFH